MGQCYFLSVLGHLPNFKVPPSAHDSAKKSTSQIATTVSQPWRLVESCQELEPPEM